MGGRGSKSKTAVGITQNVSTENANGAVEENNDASGEEKWQEFFDKYVDPISYDLKQWPEGLAQDLRSQGLNASSVFQLWLEENNDYEKPVVVSNAELDKMIDEGAELILRGMPNSTRNSAEYKLEQVMYEDKYYSGNGIYGDGLYFADNVRIAVSYTLNGGVNPGAIMRAVLAKDAKVIDYGQMYDMMRNAYPTMYIDDGLISAYARSLGYDAMSVGRRGDDQYIVVLNRGKLVIANELGKVKAPRYGAPTVYFSEEVRLS